MLSTLAKKEIKPIEKNPSSLGLTRLDNQKVVDFFALLIKIDKRTSPHLYQIKKNEDD